MSKTPGPTPFLTRDQIMGVGAVPHKQVYVPHWKGHVYIRPLSAAEYEQISNSHVQATRALAAEHQLSQNRAARRRGAKIEAPPSIGMLQTVIWCTLDENGQNLFTDADMQWLEAQPAGVVRLLADAVDELSGFDDVALEEEAEDMRGNPSGGSATA